jgi:hypothetical protein
MPPLAIDDDPGCPDVLEPPSAPLASYAVDCEGCGDVGDWFGAEDELLEGGLIQCDSCKKYLHSACMQDPLSFSLRNNDSTWFCPSCRDIVVWRDTR